MTFTIERAEASRLDALCAIERKAVQLFRGHRAWPAYAAVAMPRSDLLRALARGFVWVALDAAGAELGFVWLDPLPADAVVAIAEIDVLPAHGRRGIGAALLEHACAWARAAGYRRVDLGTLADVPWNAPFYAKHGFAVVDKRAPAFALALAHDRENGFPDDLRVFMSRPLAAPAAGEWTAWPAPARLTLLLRLLDDPATGGRRRQIAFRLLDWGDEVRLRVRPDGLVRWQGAAACAAALAAARRLQAHARTALGADIAVERRTPAAGGLAAGRSITASVLAGLDALWGCGLDAPALAALAPGSCAEVAAFLHGRTAWLAGDGHPPLPLALPRRHYLVLDPGEPGAAGDFAAAGELTAAAAPATISTFISGETAENAFTAVVRKRHPRVAAALDWLGRYGAARLSGSGGCAFLEVRTLEQAQALAARCPPAFVPHVATGVAVSPLHEALARHRRYGH